MLGAKKRNVNVPARHAWAGSKRSVARGVVASVVGNVVIVVMGRRDGRDRPLFNVGGCS
jgi:hypothetical protein